MKIELQAYGKVNLGLDVLRRRPDGYHEVKINHKQLFSDILLFLNPAQDFFFH